MITPLVNQSDDVGSATFPVSLVTGPDREGKRAVPPLDDALFVSNGGIADYGTAGLSAGHIAADSTHPSGRQFRTSGHAVG